MLKHHCQALGRPYERIHRTSATVCSIAATDEQAFAQLPDVVKSQFGDRISSGLIGSPETIRKRLADFEAADVQELILAFVNKTDLEQIRFFAREFIS